MIGVASIVHPRDPSAQGQGPLAIYRANPRTQPILNFPTNGRFASHLVRRAASSLLHGADGGAPERQGPDPVFVWRSEDDEEPRFVQPE